MSTYRNPHSDYIDKRIADLRDSSGWNTTITNTSHEDFIRDFASNVFTNFVRSTFTAAYLKKNPCSDCKKPSQQRCHGLGNESRPHLIKKALERVYPDTSKSITLREILIAFLEEHKTTKFTFKCTPCHKKEEKPVKFLHKKKKGSSKSSPASPAPEYVASGSSQTPDRCCSP